MNAPGGGGNAASDKLIVQTVLQADKAAAAQAGAQSAKSWLDSFRQAIGNAPMPGGAQAPGRGAASGSIYGQQAGQPGAVPDYRNSGTRGAPPPSGPRVGGTGAPTGGAPAAAGEEDDGRVYSRTPQDIRRFRVRRATASEAERQQAISDKEDADEQKRIARDARVARLESNRQRIQRQRQAREQRLDLAGDFAAARAAREQELRQGAADPTGARGVQDLILQQQEQDRKRAEDERKAQEQQRARAEREARQQETRQRREAQSRVRARDASSLEVARRLDEAGAGAVEARGRAEGLQRTIDQARAREHQEARALLDRDMYNQQAAARLDAAGQEGVRRRAIAQQTGIGGFFAQRNLVATDAMQGGLGPVPRATSYALSAAGNMLLLGMPLLNAIQGGGLGDINIPTPFGNIQGPQGDIQTTRRLNAQANAERLRTANISYGRSLYGAQIETQALGIARTREGIQYGFQQADITRAGTRETADYARDTVRLQREALVHQRDYARQSEDLVRRRQITERDYSRQVEDTGRQRMLAERDYGRQIQDNARARVVTERGFQRQYQDLSRERRETEIQFYRQRQDLNRSFIQDTIQFTRQQQDLSRQRTTLGIGYARQQQDVAIATGREDEDYRRQRGRAQVAIQDTIKLREIEGRTNLRDLRIREQDIGASQFQSIGSLIGAASSGDPFAIIGSLYRMRQLRQEKAIVQGDIGRGGFTEAEKYQQGVQDKQAQYGLQDLDREHARQQQDIGIQQTRNQQDYQRGLTEIGIQESRLNEDRKRALETNDIQQKRIDQDEQIRNEQLAIQEQRIGEDRQTQLEQLDIQQGRFFEDYQTNLQQIAIQDQRHFEDYAENVRQIALLQVRQAQDRITQIQQEMTAQSALDVAHARSVEDLGIQQMRTDIAHAQSLEDFEIREKAITVSITQALEDLETSRTAVMREGEAQTIALNKEMRSLWSQLALSVGLFGIFSGQFFQAAKYVAAFLGIGAGAAAGAAGAAPVVGPIIAGAGGAAFSGIGAGAGGLLAGIGLTPEVLKNFDAYMRSINPNYASPFGNITGATTAEAAELSTSPGGQNVDTGSGAAQGDFSYQRTSSETAYAEARDNWRTEKRRAGATTGPMGNAYAGYSGAATGDSAIVAGGQLGGQTGEIKSDFNASAGLVDKIKKNYEGMDTTAEDIKKRFEEAYGRAEDLKDKVGNASDYSVNIQNNLADAAKSSAQVSANMASAAGSTGGGTAAGTSVTYGSAPTPGHDPYGADFQATRTAMQQSYGNASGGLLPFHQSTQDRLTAAFRKRPGYVTPQYIYPNKAGAAGSSAAANNASTSTSTSLNLRPMPFGFRSNFSPTETVMGGGASPDNSVDALRNSIDRLTDTIQRGAVGGTTVSHSALNNKVTGVMNQWLKSGMIG